MVIHKTGLVETQTFLGSEQERSGGVGRTEVRGEDLRTASGTLGEGKGMGFLGEVTGVSEPRIDPNMEDAGRINHM